MSNLVGIFFIFFEEFFSFASSKELDFMKNPKNIKTSSNFFFYQTQHARPKKKEKKNLAEEEALEML